MERSKHKKNRQPHISCEFNGRILYRRERSSLSRIAANFSMSCLTLHHGVLERIRHVLWFRLERSQGSLSARRNCYPLTDDMNKTKQNKKNLEKRFKKKRRKLTTSRSLLVCLVKAALISSISCL